MIRRFVGFAISFALVFAQRFEIPVGYGADGVSYINATESEFSGNNPFKLSLTFARGASVGFGGSYPALGNMVSCQSRSTSPNRILR